MISCSCCCTMTSRRPDPRVQASAYAHRRATGLRADRTSRTCCSAPGQSADELSGGIERRSGELSRNERQRLFAYFRDDVDALEKMIGRDLSRWDPGGSYSVELAIDPWKERFPGRARQERRRYRSLLRANGRLDRGSRARYLASNTARDTLPGVERARPPEPDHLAAAHGRRCPEEERREPVWPTSRTSSTTSRCGVPGRGRRSLDRDERAAVARRERRIAVRRDARGVVGGLVFVNQLTHGWDLATATGQDATIPPSLLEVADRLVRGVFMLMPRIASSSSTSRCR